MSGYRPSGGPDWLEWLWILGVFVAAQAALAGVVAAGALVIWALRGLLA